MVSGWVGCIPKVSVHIFVYSMCMLVYYVVYVSISYCI